AMRNRLVLISCFSAVVAFAQAAPRPLSAGPSCTGWSTQGELEMLGRTTGGGLDGVIRRVVDPRTGRWANGPTMAVSRWHPGSMASRLGRAIGPAARTDSTPRSRWSLHAAKAGLRGAA